MRLALEQAAKAEPAPGAFSVGCVITSTVKVFDGLPPYEGRHVVATGYSRELVGNNHAEANAIKKLEDHFKVVKTSDLSSDDQPLAKVLTGASLYTTLEPCSVRTSGLMPCVDKILMAGIRRVCVGALEPSDFVVCEGTKKLMDAGVKVELVVDPHRDLREECLAAARRGNGVPDKDEKA